MCELIHNLVQEVGRMNKFKTALYTSLILSSAMMILSITDGGLWIFGIVLIYSLAGNLAYGIPVSLLSDWLTKKFSRGRMVAAGFIHAYFGGITYYVIDKFAWFAVVCAVIFFLIDEWLKRKNTTGVDRENKRFYLKLLSVVSLLAIVILAMNWIPSKDHGERMKNRFLIPEGYEGTIVIFYGMPDRPALEKDGEVSVIPIEIESLPTLMRTDIERYGIYQTSTQDMGFSQSQYFYKDGAGNLTPIADECIYRSGGGGMTSSDGKEMVYDEFQVTESACGGEFSLDGNERYSAQEREIVKYYNEFWD
jgi:MFS family permease